MQIASGQLRRAQDPMPEPSLIQPFVRDSTDRVARSISWRNTQDQKTELASSSY